MSESIGEVWMVHTLHLVLECLDLRIGIMDELVHLLAQSVVFLSEALCEMLLVDDFL